MNNIIELLGEFLEWVEEERGLHLCSYSGYSKEYIPTAIVLEKLLAKFFNIDLGKVNKEKREMLNGLRKGKNKIKELERGYQFIIRFTCANCLDYNRTIPFTIQDLLSELREVGWPICGNCGDDLEYSDPYQARLLSFHAEQR